MSATVQERRAASTGRMVLFALAAFFGLLMAAAVALWVKLGTVVFFDLVAAGIAYCL